MLSETPGETATDQADALLAALLELERHVARNGWDQAPRLFALVLTDVIAAAEPAVAAELGLRGTAAGGPPAALTAVEQEEFAGSGDLVADLARLEWPDTVFGCALTAVRTFLPSALEHELPDDPGAAAAYVAAHPQRQEMRIVVGADRAGNRHGLARLVDQPAELLGSRDLVPGLAEALAHTLASTEEPLLRDSGEHGPRAEPCRRAGSLSYKLFELEEKWVE